MRTASIIAVAVLLTTSLAGRQATTITTAGQPAELAIRSAGPNSLRVTLKPVSFAGDFPATPAVADRSWPAASISVRSADRRLERTVGKFRVIVEASPLSVRVQDDNRQVQLLRFESDGTLGFDVDDSPVLGMGEGGPRPARGTP